MMRRLAARTLHTALIALGLAAGASTAHAAPSIEACLAASDHGQVSRDEGRLRDARTEFTRCSDEACPALVRAQCHKWLADLEALQPTVVPSARDEAGADVVDARVRVDEEPSPRAVDGLPVPLDPGRHTLTFEAGGRSVATVVVLRAGEKNRIVAVTVPKPTPPSPTARPPLRLEGRAADAPIDGSGPRWAPYALAGVGVLGLASFAFFGATGNSDLSSLESAPCAATRTCAASEVSSIRTRFVVADVSLAVAVVASVGAVLLWPRAK